MKGVREVEKEVGEDREGERRGRERRKRGRDWILTLVSRYQIRHLGQKPKTINQESFALPRSDNSMSDIFGVTASFLTKVTLLDSFPLLWIMPSVNTCSITASW